jgi:TonB family protein
VTSEDRSPHPSVRALRVRFVVFPHYGINKPRGEVWNAYPELAQRMGVTGLAVVRCQPDSDGVLKHCSVAEEDPGAGFGRASVNIIQVGQMRVTSDQQGEVFVPIGFYLKPCPKPPDKWFSVCGNRYPKGY